VSCPGVPPKISARIIDTPQPAFNHGDTQSLFALDFLRACVEDELAFLPPPPPPPPAMF
jgi:hypothetical protein